MPFIVLGVGADPRIDGYLPVSSPEATEAAMRYVLIYPQQSAGVDPMLLDFLLEGGLEILFGLLDFL